MSLAAPRVLYRGPPGMKKTLYYFVGTVFTGAGCYQGFLLTQHLSWPLFTRDVEQTKMAPAMLRYATGAAVALTGGGLGLFFFWTPSRLATRVTLYPATSQIGVRTSASPVRAFLPASMRSKKAAPLNPKDNRERLHSLEALYRRDGNSAVAVAQYAEGKGRAVASATSGKQKVPSSLLLGEDVTFGYQLEAAPTPLYRPITENLYKKWWSQFKLSMRGDTDWTKAPGQSVLSEAESKARLTSDPKDPWFLDRKNFDKLFPVRKYGSR
ncbi:hypothetical protein BCV70DRAFT_198904 [Testicularia cyperi]|uniref:Uncharacterized protein n=1 Tax=Testicularia cyperi TaxID=1882483 RepID=A0A317XUI5_9BASI|nr:hypothetical protein BCV70DRAFT_198904 [Testicularia cyperi]